MSASQRFLVVCGVRIESGPDAREQILLAERFGQVALDPWRLAAVAGQLRRRRLLRRVDVGIYRLYMARALLPNYVHPDCDPEAGGHGPHRPLFSETRGGRSNSKL